MKRISVTTIGLFLVLTILLTSTSFVIAAPVAGGPSISPSSGGGTAKLTLIPVSKLPGTEMKERVTIIPRVTPRGYDVQWQRCAGNRFGRQRCLE